MKPAADWDILRCPNPDPRRQIDRTIVPVPHHTFRDRTWWKPQTWRLHRYGTCTGCGLTFSGWVAAMDLEKIVDG